MVPPRQPLWVRGVGDTAQAKSLAWQRAETSAEQVSSACCVAPCPWPPAARTHAHGTPTPNPNGERSQPRRTSGTQARVPGRAPGPPLPARRRRRHRGDSRQRQGANWRVRTVHGRHGASPPTRPNRWRVTLRQSSTRQQNNVGTRRDATPRHAPVASSRIRAIEARGTGNGCREIRENCYCDTAIVVVSLF
jgi:hypothetical protein